MSCTIKQILLYIGGVIVTVISLLGIHSIGLSLKKTALLGVAFFAALAIHYVKYSRDKEYFKKMFSIQKDPNRRIEYDYLRVMAVVFVIVTHAIQTDLNEQGVILGDAKIYIYRAIALMTLSCNLIYVMLSGALLLPTKEESILKFYYTRYKKILIPLVVYYIWHIWQYSEIGTITIKEIVCRLYEGNTPEAPHYWLIYVILSLYIAFPFIRSMLKNLSYKNLTVLVCISIVMMGLKLYIPLTMGITTFFAEWIGVAIIGYWMTQPETKKRYPYIMLLGVFGLVSMLLLIRYNANYLQLSVNCSPIMCFFAMGLFAFVCKLKDLVKKDFWLVRLLSKYSYSIILIHWWSLHWITIRKLQISTGDYYGFGIIIALVCTLLVSLLAAFVIDNYICCFIFWLIGMAEKFVMKLKEQKV